MDYEHAIEEALGLLAAEPEWHGIWAGYAARIMENEAHVAECRRRFRLCSALKLYLTTTNAMNAGRKLRLDVRYLGQTVAGLTCEHGKVRLSTGPYEQNNEQYFGCKIALPDCAWDDPKASRFRSHFKKRYADRENNGDSPRIKVHRLESLLLTEFSKASKPLGGVRPIKIAGLHFTMPTPLRVFQEKIGYAGPVGGDIDILASVGRGRGTKLCVIKLKKDKASADLTNTALTQAIRHAVFIRELLRGKAGPDWWKLFKFKGEIPKNLTLLAACAMRDSEDADTSFGGRDCPIGEDGKDTIQLHHIYFEETGDGITITRPSLWNHPQPAQ